jgi:hypothetical protein
MAVRYDTGFKYRPHQPVVITILSATLYIASAAPMAARSRPLFRARIGLPARTRYL